MPKAAEDSQVLASLAMVMGDVSSDSVEFLGLKRLVSLSIC